MRFRGKIFSLATALSAFLARPQLTYSFHAVGGVSPPTSALSRPEYPKERWSDTRRYASKPDGGGAGGDCVFISSSTSLSLPPEASLTFPRVLVIEGQFTGDIGCTAQSSQETGVLVRKGGELHADVTCVRTVEVFGRLFGRIECEQLIIGSSGEVIGDVTAASLRVESGGSIIGRCNVGSARQQREIGTNPNAGNHETDSRNLVERRVKNSNVAHSKTEAVGKLGHEPGHDSSPLDTGDHFGRQVKHSRPSQQTQPKEAPNSAKGNFVDSFGNPLVRDAPNDAVESIRRNREIVKETQDILKPKSLTAPPPPKKKKESMVDDFGNPLIRGASNDEVDSLRRNRELVKEAREIMDRHTRGKARSSSPNEKNKRSGGSDSSGPDVPPFLR